MNHFKFLLILLITANTVNSQDQRTIEIIQAGKSIRNSVEYPGANILQRDNDIRVILFHDGAKICLLYTSPSPRDQRGSRMPSSA